MESMISALAVLVDEGAVDGPDSVGIRAAALDAAIAHMAGDGCKVADITGKGDGVVGCARTFERYLTGAEADRIAPGTELRTTSARRLREAAALLARKTTDGDEERLVGDLYALAGILDGDTDLVDGDTVVVPTQELHLVVGSLANAMALLSAAGYGEQDNAEQWAQRRDAAVSALDRLLGQLNDRLADTPGGR